jgi:hypothetical protein
VPVAVDISSPHGWDTDDFDYGPPSIVRCPV